MPKKTQFRAPPKPCVICGINDVASDEHVPPQGFYTDKSAGQLATVPACNSCNQGTSVGDQEFILALGFLAKNSSAGQFRGCIKYWETHVRPILERNPGIVQAASSSIKIAPVPILIDGEFRHPSLIASEWVHRVVGRSLTKCVRGFYWRFYKKILPASVPMTGFFIESPIPINPEFKRHVVGDQFACYAGQAPSGPYDTIWLLRFFQLCLIVETGLLARPGEFTLGDLSAPGDQSNLPSERQ